MEGYGSSDDDPTSGFTAVSEEPVKQEASNDDFDDEPEESIFPEEEFENWADSVVDEALDKQRIAMLNKMIGKTLPVGPDATNAINSLKGIIDDEGLMNELKDLADNDTESCARPAIYRYIQKNNPEALDDLDFGDMKKEDDDTTDVTIDKDGAMKLAGDEEPKDEKASTEDIIEFVRSFYDKETGAFPKGETGVVISARKRFGDSVGDLVEKFVSKLSGNKVQVENDEDVEEGNAFGAAVTKAKEDGDTEFEVDGKTYPVKSVDKDDKENAKKFANESKSMKLTSMLNESFGMGELPSEKLMKMKVSAKDMMDSVKNKTTKKIVEGYSTEEKRIVLLAVRKLMKYKNIDINLAAQYVVGAAEELKMDIDKGRVKK